MHTFCITVYPTVLAVALHEMFMLKSHMEISHCCVICDEVYTAV